MPGLAPLVIVDRSMSADRLRRPATLARDSKRGPPPSFGNADTGSRVRGPLPLGRRRARHDGCATVQRAAALAPMQCDANAVPRYRRHGLPLQLALRYLGSKKRAFISVGTAFAILGRRARRRGARDRDERDRRLPGAVREKVLGVNAHVLVLKYSTDFREYRDVMKKVRERARRHGVAPFIINPMMVTHGERTATGVLLKGVDPELDAEGARPAAAHRRGLARGPAQARRAAAEAARSSAGRSARDADARRRRRRSPALARTPARRRSSADRDGRAQDARRRWHAPRDAIARDAETAAQAREPRRTARRPRRPRADRTGRPRRRPRASVARSAPAGRHARRRLREQAPRRRRRSPRASIPIRAEPRAVAELPGVVIGKSLAKQPRRRPRRLRAGHARRRSASRSARAARARPIAKQFRVIAIFEAGFDQYDSKLVYTDLYEAQAFYEQGDSVTGVEMKVDDIDTRARHREARSTSSSPTASTTRWTGRS